MKKYNAVKALVVAAMITLSASVFAHGSMMETYPQDGAMMMEPVDHLQLHFGTPVRLINVQLTTTDATEVPLDFKPSMEEAAEFKVGMPALKPDTYTVHWMIMGGDGHKMKGSFGFVQH